LKIGGEKEEKEFSKIKDKGLVIYGKPGIGKSILIPLIAKELNMTC